jgi:ABC-type sugar transport system permease subunit
MQQTQSTPGSNNNSGAGSNPGGPGQPANRGSGGNSGGSGNNGKDRNALLPLSQLNFRDWAVRLVFLAFLDGLAIWFASSIYSRENSPIIPIALLLVTALINYIFLSERLYPLRWLSPGLLMLLLMVIYPLGYNIYISFTNDSSGHSLSREQAVAQLKQQTFQPPDAATYAWTAYRNSQNQYKIILQNKAQNKSFIGDESGLQAYPNPPDPLPATLEGGYTKLSNFQAAAAGDQLAKLNLKSGDLSIQITSSTEAKALTSKYSYDPASGNLTDLQTKVVYTPQKGTFTAPDGTTLSPGFTAVVGWDNYAKVFSDNNITGPFISVFIWTFIFAGLSVFLTFSVGLGMALILNDDQLPLRTLFRVLLFIPYAIPGFISALIWAGLFSIIGPVGEISKNVLGQGFSWFSDPNAAKAMLLFVNTWLGYPYMMLICLGALQSIPLDIYEAATIDGASRVQKFWGLTLPLLLVSVGPLLIGSFAFNFNNFGIIQLMTQGGPDNPGTTTPAGQTDILISYTYRLAFASGKGSDLGLAATISLFIFIIIAAITTFSFRYTKQLEEVLS